MYMIFNTKSVAKVFHLLITVPIYFDLSYWSSSGTEIFIQLVQLMRQLV